MTATATATDLSPRDKMHAEYRRRRYAFEALEAQGMVAITIERQEADIRVILRVPDADTQVESIVEVMLAYDTEYTSRLIAGWVRYYDTELGRHVDLDGAERARGWLRKAEATPVRETSTRDGVVTEFLDWR